MIWLVIKCPVEAEVEASGHFRDDLNHLICFEMGQGALSGLRGKS
jgi:hypothetical protein